MDERAGRVLSAKNEKKLQEALAALNEVLAQLASEDDGRSLRGLADPYEQRTVHLDNVEIRAEGSQIAGYAAVFDQLSQPLGGFRERIARGAFGQSLTKDIRALWQHDTSRVLGRTTNGSLRLWEDDQGLGFELTPPDTQDGRDSLALIARGDVDQMSFGFTVPQGGDEWTQDENGRHLRTLNRVDLIEVSPVTFPAYLGTSADVLRNAPEWVQRALLPDGVDHSSTEKDGNDNPRARLALLAAKLRILAAEG